MKHKLFDMKRPHVKKVGRCQDLSRYNPLIISSIYLQTKKQKHFVSDNLVAYAHFNCLELRLFAGFFSKYLSIPELFVLFLRN